MKLNSTSIENILQTSHFITLTEHNAHVNTNSNAVWHLFLSMSTLLVLNYFLFKIFALNAVLFLMSVSLLIHKVLFLLFPIFLPYCSALFLLSPCNAILSACFMCRSRAHQKAKLWKCCWCKPYSNRQSRSKQS